MLFSWLALWNISADWSLSLSLSLQVVMWRPSVGGGGEHSQCEPGQYSPSSPLLSPALSSEHLGQVPATSLSSPLKVSALLILTSHVSALPLAVFTSGDSGADILTLKD